MTQPRRVWFDTAGLLVDATLAALTRRDIQGFEHVPARGGVIVAANHISPADGVVIGAALHDRGRLPRLLTKAELFTVPVVGRVIRGLGQIPVERAGADPRAALGLAVEALGEGACVVIFPEGTNTKDPDRWPMRAHSGVGQLALMSGAPVIPVAQWGQHAFFGPDKKPRLTRPLRKPVRLLAGPPVDLGPAAGAEVTREQARVATDLVMDRIRAQLGILRGEPVPPAPTAMPRLVGS